MAEIVFNPSTEEVDKSRGNYVASITITEKSAIHIEREAAGVFQLWQSHKSGGKHAVVAGRTYYGDTIDEAVIDPAEKYPLYIKCYSETPVISAELI